MALREYRDEAGVQWRVWNVKPTSFVAPTLVGQPADDERPPWLCFESPGEKRRLIPAPERWDERSDDELESMRRQAEVVVPRPAALT